MAALQVFGAVQSRTKRPQTSMTSAWCCSSRKVPPRQELDAVAAACSALELDFDGKDTNKEEFVTAGGVRLKEINFKTYESKSVPGLHFCGELVDVDGVTGGFNFMHCWCSGFAAGTSAAEYSDDGSCGNST